MIIEVIIFLRFRGGYSSVGRASRSQQCPNECAHFSYALSHAYRR